MRVPPQGQPGARASLRTPTNRDESANSNKSDGRLARLVMASSVSASDSRALSLHARRSTSSGKSPCSVTTELKNTSATCLQHTYVHAPRNTHSVWCAIWKPKTKVMGRCSQRRYAIPRCRTYGPRSSFAPSSSTGIGTACSGCCCLASNNQSRQPFEVPVLEQGKSSCRLSKRAVQKQALHKSRFDADRNRR